MILELVWDDETTEEVLEEVLEDMLEELVAGVPQFLS